MTIATAAELTRTFPAQGEATPVTMLAGYVRRHGWFKSGDPTPHPSRWVATPPLGSGHPPGDAGHLRLHRHEGTAYRQVTGIAGGCPYRVVRATHLDGSDVGSPDLKSTMPRTYPASRDPGMA